MSERNDLALYVKKKNTLGDICEQASGQLEAVSLVTLREDLLHVKKQLDTNVFRLMVVGEFSAGKSTFINALLGEDVLPAYPIPTTAFINEVRYGEQKRALLHFLNPLPEIANLDGIPGVRAYAQQFSGRPIPPMEIAVDEVEKYAAIPMDMDQDEANRSTPFEKLELFWPLEYLKNGIEIIDSPGLNEAPHRTVITNGYIRNADVVLFLTLSQKALTESELKYVDSSLDKMGFSKTNTFLMTTYFDLQLNKSRTMLRQYVPAKAKERFRDIYFISAYNALICKEQSNPNAADAFDFWRAEEDIVHFLTEECGRVRLETLRSQMLGILGKESAMQLETKEKLLRADVGALKTRVQSAEPELKKLEARAKTMESSLMAQVNVLLGAVDIDVRAYYSDLGDKVAGWAAEYTPQTQVRVMHMNADTKELAKEYADHLLGLLSSDQEDFFNSTLIQGIDRHFQTMIQSIGANVESFFQDLQSIRNDVTQTQGAPIDSMSQYWKDVLKNGVSLFTDGVDKVTGGLADNQAFKGVLKSIMGSLLLVFSPISWLATIVGAIVIFVFNRGKTVSNAIEGCRETVVSNIRQECTTIAPSAVEQIHKNLEEQLKAIVKLLMKDLTRETDNLRKQFADAVNTLQMKQTEVDKELARFTQCRKALDQLTSRLSQMSA